jgi:hypothetical protein
MENNRHFMILFVTLKEAYTFFYEGKNIYSTILPHKWTGYDGQR